MLGQSKFRIECLAAIVIGLAALEAIVRALLFFLRRGDFADLAVLRTALNVFLEREIAPEETHSEAATG